MPTQMYSENKNRQHKKLEQKGDFVRLNQKAGEAILT